MNYLIVFYAFCATSVHMYFSDYINTLLYFSIVSNGIVSYEIIRYILIKGYFNDYINSLLYFTIVSNDIVSYKIIRYILIKGC
jgi:hypothetical protein